MNYAIIIIGIYIAYIFINLLIDNNQRNKVDKGTQDEIIFKDIENLNPEKRKNMKEVTDFDQEVEFKNDKYANHTDGDEIKNAVDFLENYQVIKQKKKTVEDLKEDENFKATDEELNLYELENGLEVTEEVDNPFDSNLSFNIENIEESNIENAKVVVSANESSKELAVRKDKGIFKSTGIYDFDDLNVFGSDFKIDLENAKEIIVTPIS